MKHLKPIKQYHLERPTEFPAVIGYNRLITDNKPTHKFLREIGIDQNEPNYLLIIEFVQRFLKDLHRVDRSAYENLCSFIHEFNEEHHSKTVEPNGIKKEHREDALHNIHNRICQKIKDIDPK